MKHQQAKHIVGHVTLHVKGENPELFFQNCASQGIVSWNIKKTAQDQCQGTIYLQALLKVKKLLEGTSYELVSVEYPKGLLPVLKKLWQRQAIILTAFLCMLLLFVLSNIAWKVEINNVPEEMERKIKVALKEEGLYKGAWAYNLNSLDSIQQQTLRDLPELMYIGIEKKGTSYHIDVIEKKQEKIAESLPNQDLIAAKDGEIKRLLVKNGISQVNVHDIVNKGDLLVSGELEEEKKEDDDKEPSAVKQVAAEGEVYANTWYEMAVTSALKPISSSLTGEKHKRFHLVLSNFSFPIWGFKQPYDDYMQEKKEHTLHLFNYELPISMKTEIFNEVNKEAKGNMDKKGARNRAIQHIEENIRRRSGSDAEILYYKVLHERTENGKVKINLYVSVLEDIAKEKALN